MAGHVASLIRTTVSTEEVSGSSGSSSCSSSIALLASASLQVCGRAYHQGTAGSPGQLAQA